MDICTSVFYGLMISNSTDCWDFKDGAALKGL